MKTLLVGSYGMVGGLILVVLLGAVFGLAFLKNNRGGKLLTDTLSEPLNDATTAKIDINSGTGNLTIDRLTGGEPLLASGTLQYLDQGNALPTRTLNSGNGQATLTLKGGSTSRPRFHFPWEACMGDGDWQIHLNPTVAADITAYSGGGNLGLNLARMAVTRVSADTGGGNVDVVLPDEAANLNVIAKTGGGNVTVAIGKGITGSSVINATSGAGNVVVQVPDGIAARIHATSGLGKTIVDSRFTQTGKDTYQTSDFDSAADKVEITLSSGAGNVSVNAK